METLSLFSSLRILLPNIIRKKSFNSGLITAGIAPGCKRRFLLYTAATAQI